MKTGEKEGDLSFYYINVLNILCRLIKSPSTRGKIGAHT